MAWPYDDETAGPYGSVSQVPLDTWFPVNTATGEWSLPGPSTPAPTLGAVSGTPLGLGLDLTSPWPGTGQGYGVRAPGTPAIGQVTGLGTPTTPTPSALTRPAGREPLSAFLPQQPTVWESIARGVGMATPQGRAILQGYDQQQQQGLTNRLALRRQQLLEEQETRQATQTSLETLRKISEMPNKTMRNLMFDRYVADMGSSGQPLPTDMVEAFKKSSLDEGKQMAQMLTPMFEAAGIDPQAASQILQEGGDPKRLLDMVDLGLKAKKQKAEEAEEARIAQQRTQYGAGTLGDVSGTTQPPPASTTGTPAPPPPTTTGAPARQGPASTGLDTAVTEATKLYPQVRPDLVHGIIRHESNYDVGAVSPKGALGPMQLMPGTAKDMGVDPKDPAQNVRGGVRYYAQLLTKYNGNEALALAAYNWGPGNVDKVGGDLTKMPAETQAYVKNVLGTAASGQRGAVGTQGQVAGPGAPAVPAADQAQLQALTNRIHLADQLINQNMGSGRERTKGWVNELQQERQRLLQERDKLMETPRLVERERQLGGVRAAQAEEEARRLQPLKLEQAEAGKALTPIATETAKSLANNNSIYRSLGKIETLMQDVANLPPDFINLVSRNAPEVQAALASDPAQLTGIIQGWKTQLGAASSGDPRINRFLAALGNLRDLAIAERAGASVTGNELTRATGAFFGSLPNINQAFSLFAENMSSVKERVMDQLVIQGSTVRPLSGGKAVYGALPKEVRDRIEANERGEYDEPGMAQKPGRTQPATPAQTPPTPRTGGLAGPIRQGAP